MIARFFLARGRLLTPLRLVLYPNLDPVPSSAPGWRPGRTEEMVGTWLAANPEWRNRVIVATKVMGFAGASQVPANRSAQQQQDAVGELPKGEARLDAASVHAACAASLRRLQLETIDLYQLHWPDRYVPLWGATAYDEDAAAARDSSNGGSGTPVPIEETARALKELLDAGKIRAYGLSNETTFGVCEWVRIAKELGMPPPASIQNAFSLLNRSFETELAEACAPRHHNMGLLPWSPLCGGLLAGKYEAGAASEPLPDASNARFTLFPTFQTRWASPSDNSKAAVRAYMQLAHREGLSLATLALAWCASRRYAASTIIGATTLEQLKEDIDAFDPAVQPPLSAECLTAIDEIHLHCRDPCTKL